MRISAVIVYKFTQWKTQATSLIIPVSNTAGRAKAISIPIRCSSMPKAVTFTFDGRPLTAHANETVAAALVANGIRAFRHSIKEHRPRGFFCGIGRCSSCCMIINGVPNVRSCVTLVEQGMTVETQEGIGSINGTA